MIARQTTRMERLTRDLLRLARLDAGQEPPEYSPCRLDDLFAAVLTDLDRFAQQKRQRLRAHRPVHRPDRGDPQQLHDAIKNLVENAIATRRPERRWRLRRRPSTIDCASRSRTKDQAFRQRTFRDFSSASIASTKEDSANPAALALGLAIVKHIVERMDGRVHAGKSTRRRRLFTIELPLRGMPVATA